MNAVITGLGSISAAGRNVPETLRMLASGRRNPGPVTLFPTELSIPVFEVRSIPDQQPEGKMRTVHLALHAVREAVEDAEWEGELSISNIGVSLGTTVASQLNDIGFYRSLRERETLSLEPVDRYLKGNLADAVADVLELTGPRCTVCNACSSGADAIGVALSWLRTGVCDAAVAGGADELNLVPLSGFYALGVSSDEPCAPFDRDRKGLNLGEGAGVLLLETESHARKRGRTPELLLRGYGSSSDAFHLTAPRPDGSGLKTAIRRALNEACIEPSQVAFVNAHGTATRENDKVESKVFAETFGGNLNFLSTKGFTGHTLGAAGGIEAALTVASLREGWIPPSVGFVNLGTDVSLPPVTEKTAVKGSFALSTSLAFGGQNAALLFERL